MYRVGRRGTAAIGHDLDEIGAAFQLLAGGAANLGLTVADAAERAEAMARRRREPVVIAAAEIGMAAGLAERLAGDDEARCREVVLLRRLLQAEIGAADIAHRGEAAQQHLAHDHQRAHRYQ